jgi:chorismate dehydratase
VVSSEDPEVGGAAALTAEGGRDARVEGARALRVGIVHYLNSWPLAWSFLSGRAPAELAPVYLPPARVADGLAAGELEVGLVPSVELQRIPGLRVVPGLCIASQHEVRSVLLVSRVAPKQIRRVALDESSRTSAILVRILLAERHAVRPEAIPFRPDLDAMLAEADAALLIGDPALRVPRDRFHVVDLAAEWRALTGLPFVFAVWAVAAGVEGRGLAGWLAASLEAARREMPHLVSLAAAETGLDEAEVRTYLTEHLSYHLGSAERASLDELFRRAHQHGLLPAPRPIAFLPHD